MTAARKIVRPETMPAMVSPNSLPMPAEVACSEMVLNA